MGFGLTVLGSAGSYCAAGRMCSGYLLTAGDTKVMVDAGNGSTANLQRTTAFTELDAILVTHRHVDHCVDLIGMFYALKFHPDGPRGLDLYAAPEVLDALTGLLSHDSRMEFRDVFHCREVDAGDHFEVGPIGFDLYRSIHPVPTVSVRASVGDSVLAYSSDSAGGDDLVEAARDADLFLCESTWLGDMEDWPAGIHLTPNTAGEHAAKAEVGHLLLTHLIGSAPRDRFLIEARETWDGPLALAEDNESWSVRT